MLADDLGEGDAAARQYPRLGFHRVQIREQRPQHFALDDAFRFARFADQQRRTRKTQLGELPIEHPVVENVFERLALLDLVQRRLGDVHPAGLHQRTHVAEEEGQQQRADVRAVHVGVGHDDDLAVTALGRIELVVADAAADGGDHLGDLLVGEHLVHAGFFDVEDLTLQRQDGLGERVSPLLGDAAGRVALHEIQFGFFQLPAPAVPQLAGKSAAAEGRFCATVRAPAGRPRGPGPPARPSAPRDVLRWGAPRSNC